MTPTSEAPEAPGRIRAPSGDLTGRDSLSPSEQAQFDRLKADFARLSPYGADPVLTGRGTAPVRRPSNPDAERTPR